MKESYFKYGLAFLIFTVGIFSECWGQSNLDSLIQEHVSATRGICREVRNLESTLDKSLTDINTTHIDTNEKISKASILISDSVLSLKELRNDDEKKEPKSGNWFTFLLK